MHGWGFSGLVCLGILSVQGDLAAQVETDLNIATGLDITASVGRDSGWSGSGPPWAGLANLRQVAVGPPWPDRRHRLTEAAV